MRKRNGFTLVELLAVIVVLAILMIVAFPAVLDVMENAKDENMKMMGEKMLKDAQTQYVYDSSIGSRKSATTICYNMKAFKYASQGDYDGYVVVDATNRNEVTYTVVVSNPTKIIEQQEATGGNASWTVKELSEKTLTKPTGCLDSM